MPPGPRGLTYRPNISRGARIWTLFRVPDPERGVKRFPCFRISPFRGARSNLTRILCTRNPHSTHFLVPTGAFGRIYLTEPVSGRNISPRPGQNTVRFGKDPKIPVGTKKCWSGVSGTETRLLSWFWSSTRNGDLQPSDPETPDPLNSPFRDRNPERRADSSSPQNLGSVRQNLRSWGIYTQRQKVTG